MLGIGTLLGKVFGSDKAVSSMISNVSNGIDALVYTDEEKASDAKQERSEGRKMIVEWMKSTQGQNLARRLIALSVTGIWLLQYVIAIVMNVIAVWVDNPEQWKESAKIINESAQSMNAAMMLILAFYFAAPHMGEIAKVAMKKFGKNP